MASANGTRSSCVLIVINLFSPIFRAHRYAMPATNTRYRLDFSRIQRQAVIIQEYLI